VSPYVTPRTLEILAAITETIDAAAGKPVKPRLEDLATAAGIKISPLYRHLLRLREAGYISWTPGKQRAIQIVKRLSGRATEKAHPMQTRNPTTKTS
jgi:DNA-binding IclR family transcriptional regulator